ncbi:hypothetical protein RJT34_16075 [Clitoria ternatea]|uniref:VOC domain-containing protein n=1 Tax=Clitoria ternatea TaxID=43366 RepID=A0AAN9J6T4_CLITE
MDGVSAPPPLYNHCPTTATSFTLISFLFCFLSPRVSLLIVVVFLCCFSSPCRLTPMAQQDAQNGSSENAAAPPAVSFVAVKPQLFVEAPKANDAVLFYKAAFGAEEVGRTLNPKRKADLELPLILSAELKIAGSSILVADLVDDSASPTKAGGNGVVLFLETEDVERAIAKAVSAGAVVESEVVEGEGAFGGGRVGKVKDPYGFVWAISSPGKKGADVEA